ncbi:MAG: TOBE domain-containing protein [Candidatus Thorarchaeota archaeon]
MWSKPTMGYGLKWNPDPPITVPQLVAIALATGVYTILSWLGVIALPVGIASVSALFIAIGFGIPFAIWFGGWGLVIGYIGSFIGAGILAGTPVLLTIPFALVDWIQFGIPLVALITKSSLERLKISQGDSVCVTFKASSVRVY